MPEAQYEFKFTIDDWTDQENFSAGDPNTVENFGFVNRFFQADGDKTLSYVWAQPQTLSIADVGAVSDALTVFPNPTVNQWSISGFSRLNSIQVYDLLGKTIINVAPNAESFDIDATNLKTGIYLARIISETGTKTVKLIKN